MQARVAKSSAQTHDWTPEQFAQFVKGEIERYREIVKLSGAKQVD